MEFKQLQSFVAVVDYGSFTKASEKLFISQPTISTHIRMLEDEFQSCLLVRTTKSIELTPRGQEFYECAVSILSLKNHLIESWINESRNVIHDSVHLSAARASSCLQKAVSGNLFQYLSKRQPGHSGQDSGRQL